MSTVVIRSGALVVQDPSDVKVYVFDWDADNLAPGVTIPTSSFTVTAVSPSTVDTALVMDSPARLTAAEASAALGRTVTLDNRATRVRLASPTVGQVYEIANMIITSETPSQTKERSFRLLGQNL